MTRRFAVGVQGATPDEEKRLRDYFDTLGTWWHWIPNFWLVIVRDDNINPNILRTNVHAIAPKRNMVVEVAHGSAWAGQGPVEPPNESYFGWMRNIWEKGF